MIWLLVDYGLIFLAAYIIFTDLEKQGKRKNFWTWMLILVLGFLFLHVIGVAIVFMIYLVWGRTL